MKLQGKLIIKGKIKAETGLHIGGSKSSLDIGGIDLNVIKTPQGVPFIPGSSLKGKLRSLLAKMEGSISITAREARGGVSDEDFPYIIQLFGSSADDNERGEVTRLIVRDAILNTSEFKDGFPSTETEENYTDIKWENTIDRKKGTAQHPRQLERVPAGAQFDFELVYDLYDDTSNSYKNNQDQEENSVDKTPISKLNKHLWALRTAMNLLQDDYLGGQGTRGYGKVSFNKIDVVQKNLNLNGDYGVSELNKDVEIFKSSLQQL